MKPIDFVFFGGEPLAVPVLNTLEAVGYLPQLVVCSPDKPVGRKQILTAPPAKVWATERGIKVFQPASYKNNELARELLQSEDSEIFIVVAYNFILPAWLLQIPKHGVVNVHPSLLPRLRGASPIRSALLRDDREAVGVSIMLLDEAMDHGPILAQKPLLLPDNDWPISGLLLDKMLAELGGRLLAETLPRWLRGELVPQEQNHELATYCGKLERADSELLIDPQRLPSGEAGRQAWLKINAFAGIGETFFMHEGKRVKIKQARLVAGQLLLERVIPEGKKEMDFTSFLKAYGAT